MFKKLWDSLNAPSTEAQARSGAYDAHRLSTLVEHFPIGRKLRYFPEFQRHVVFHTIILAYRVNDHFIYARDAVLLNNEGSLKGFRVGDTRILPLDSLDRFHILVPDTTEMEKTLDYFTRAELGRAGQFSRGNTITLVTDSTARAIFSVDTSVYRRQTMKGGPYAESATILLSPDLGSLALTDKRRKQRMETSIRADLLLDGSADVCRSILADFSETSLRLQAADPPLPMPEMQPGDRAIVEFNFGDVDTAYRIRGKVIRRADDFCVIQIEELYRDGEFERIKMIDIVEIKSGLLNLHA